MAPADRRGILFISPWLLGGGIERVLESTLPWLARRVDRPVRLAEQEHQRAAGRFRPEHGARHSGSRDGRFQQIVLEPFVEQVGHRHRQPAKKPVGLMPSEPAKPPAGVQEPQHIARAGIALYFLQRTDTFPPACMPLNRRCKPRPAVQGASLGPLGVTPAYAAGSQDETRFAGLGGKGRGGSPYAGVKH